MDKEISLLSRIYVLTKHEIKSFTPQKTVKANTKIDLPMIISENTITATGTVFIIFISSIAQSNSPNIWNHARK